MPVTVSYAFSLENQTKLNEACIRRVAFNQGQALARDAHKKKNSQGICLALAYLWVQQRLENPDADLSGWLNSNKVITKAIKVQKQYERQDAAWVGYDKQDKIEKITPHSREIRYHPDERKRILSEIIAKLDRTPIGHGVIIGITIRAEGDEPEQHALAWCRPSATSYAIFDANGGEVTFDDDSSAKSFVILLFEGTEYKNTWMHEFRFVDPANMWGFV